MPLVPFEALVDENMNEGRLLRQIVGLAHRWDWLTYHTHRSDRSEPGWPDLVLLHVARRRLLIVELKTKRGRVTPAQQQWLDGLAAVGIDARVWRPADLASGEITRTLNPASKETR